jgi:dTDP-4-amino-4,6-dideoxygalactose transaminase
MPAFTYAGLPHLAQWAGQSPRFCDIDPITHTLSPEQVSAAISKNTTSIMAVHQVNSPCQIHELESVASAHDTPIFFDSVHGLFCTYKGKPIGCFGEAEVFSLHAPKILNGFEGGYVTTNNKKLAEKLRQKREQGLGQSGKFETLGLNSKLNEIHAACALSCIEDLPHLVERNHQRLMAYHKNFEGIPGLSWIEYNDQNERMNYEFALLEVDTGWPISRDQTVNLMRAENALARPYYSPPVHLSSHCPDFVDPPKLPVTENLAKSIIQMPVGELVSIDDIALLGDFFRFLHAHAEEINDHLSKETSL